MAQRKPRILTQDTERATRAISAKKKSRKGTSSLPFATEEEKRNYVPPAPPTPLDKFYNLIYDRCVWGYRFTDNYYGIPWIEKSNIEDKGNGIYVIRFRSPVEYASEGRFGAVAKEVCEALRCRLHVFHKTKQDVYFENIKLDYEDYVWVIQPGELDGEGSEENESQEEVVMAEDEEDHFYDEIEEMSDDWANESTVDEIDDRIAKALEEFV